MTGPGWIALIIVGLLIGRAMATARPFGRVLPAGLIGGIVAGLIGAYLGGVWLGPWGWMIGGLNVIGSITGAVVIIYGFALLGSKDPFSYH